MATRCYCAAFGPNHWNMAEADHGPDGCTLVVEAPLAECESIAAEWRLAGTVDAPRYPDAEQRVRRPAMRPVGFVAVEVWADELKVYGRIGAMP